MANKAQSQVGKKKTRKQPLKRSNAPGLTPQVQPQTSTPSIQRASLDLKSLTAADVRHLQRTSVRELFLARNPGVIKLSDNNLNNTIEKGEVLMLRLGDALMQHVIVVKEVAPNNYRNIEVYSLWGKESGHKLITAKLGDLLTGISEIRHLVTRPAETRPDQLGPAAFIPQLTCRASARP